jgi:AAA domain
VVVDHPRNIQAYTDWCAGDPVETLATPHGEVAEPCIEGKCGNNMLAKTGAMARDYGLSAHVALDIAFEHHNPRCEPPWDDEQYETHFLSGYRSATGRLGWRAPYIDTSKLFKPVPMEERGPKPGDPAPPDAASLGIFYDDGLDDIPDPVWLMDGVIPEGSVTLYGKRGSMKSFAALDMALCIANGVPYHGKNVTQGRIVYFAGEGFKGNKRRIKAWYKEHKLTPSRHFALIRTAIKWDMDKGREKARQILAEVAKGGPISVAIIDTVRKGMSGDENAPTQVGHFIDGVSGVCELFGCGYWLVHHAGKDDSKGARGGGPFEDDVDAVFKFKRPTKSGPVNMECTKQKDGEDGQRYVFRPEVFKLGHEANGKPITSLVLKLESESKADEEEEGGEPGVSDRGLHALQDATAIRILRARGGLAMKRGELAVAIMAELAPEMRDDDPDAFNKAVDQCCDHLRRPIQGSPLWRYVVSKNPRGQPLTFRDPEHNGRRGEKLSRARAE